MTNITQNIDMLKLCTEYTGFEFNKICKNIKFYKVLNNNLKHYGFTYKLGLNIDKEPFDPTKTCSKGGLYFCNEPNCCIYFDKYGTKLALIEIPDDARIYVEFGRFKADRLIIKEITDFENVDDSFWVNIAPKNSKAMTYVKDQTEEICILAVQQNSEALECVKNQTDAICILAVQQCGSALEYVEKQTNKICVAAVQQDSEALQYVEKQTDKICELAVKQNGRALKYVKNQTPKICELAVKQDGWALQYVKNRTREICEMAIQQDRSVMEIASKEYETIETDSDSYSKTYSETYTDSDTD